MFNTVANSDIQQMIDQADRMAELARAGRWAAFHARRDAWLMRAEVYTRIEEFGKEEGFRRKYVTAMLPIILTGAMDHAQAEMGNIQECTDGGPLRICAQRGFDRPFLEFFATVRIGQTACSLARRKAEPVMVRDVTDSAVYDCASVVEVLLDAGVRSVQSIPLLSRTGRVLGVLSMHSSRVKEVSPNKLKRIGHFARWAATLLEWRERGTLQRYIA